MRARSRKGAFTIIEVMLAIGIFSMILISIYSIWTGILRASKAARTAADSAQRARIAIRTLEDALTTAQMFTANMPPQNPDAYYSFLADTSGDFTSLSFVAHLPATFPGVGRYGDNVVRRVSFMVEPDKDGTPALVMRQAPMMMALNEEFEPFQLTLVKDVQLFVLEFWGQHRETRREEWLTEWNSTNSMPKLIRVGIGTGKGKSGEPLDVVFRVVALPAHAVAPEWQMPGQAGAVQRRGPGGQNLNQQIPPGGFKQ